MAKSFQIDVAYCVQLNRVVDIHEACTEFFSQDLFQRFDFLCSDPRCRWTRPQGVRVTAANHNRLPTEQRRSPHFRVLDDHADDCYWADLDRAQQEAQTASKSDVVEGPGKVANPKVTRLVTKFILPTENGPATPGEAVAKELERVRKFTDAASKGQALRDYRSSLGSTATSLESLVTCFEELRTLNALDISLYVQSHGTFTFRQIFQQITFGSKPNFCVYYGGATLLKKRYGRGFVLKFFDQIDNQPVTLYVSNQNIDDYKPARRLLAIVDDLQDRPMRGKYLRVYWIGGLQHSDKGWSATFTTLAHVVFRLVEPTEVIQAHEMD